jgi:hypothetical protein
VIRVLALLLLAGPASAHEFYSGWCCNQRDCAPIPVSSVSTTREGYVIVLHPGDHPMVTVEQRFVVPLDQEMTVAPDGRWHVCLYPTQGQLRCVYRPQVGS